MPVVNNPMYAVYQLTYMMTHPSLDRLLAMTEVLRDVPDRLYSAVAHLVEHFLKVLNDRVLRRLQGSVDPTENGFNAGYAGYSSMADMMGGPSSQR